MEGGRQLKTRDETSNSTNVRRYHTQARPDGLQLLVPKATACLLEWLGYISQSTANARTIISRLISQDRGTCSKHLAYSSESQVGRPRMKTFLSRVVSNRTSYFSRRSIEMSVCVMVLGLSVYTRCA